MNLFKRYYYGDYDAIKGTGSQHITNTNSMTQGQAQGQMVSPAGKVGEGSEWPLWEVFIRSKQG
jgi:ring-1,2-phenylacetyl-CoA epoxidase subunit PaaB